MGAISATEAVCVEDAEVLPTAPAIKVEVVSPKMEVAEATALAMEGEELLHPEAVGGSLRLHRMVLPALPYLPYLLIGKHCSDKAPSIYVCHITITTLYFSICDPIMGSISEPGVRPPCPQIPCS